MRMTCATQHGSGTMTDSIEELSVDVLALLLDDAASVLEDDGRQNMPKILRAAALKLRECMDEIKRLSKPEWFYSADDPEYSGGDVQDVVDDMDREGVMQVAGAREVWKKWVAIRCVTVDENGDIDDTEAATFDTPEEAEKCWPESFAACRAAKALEAK